jgi:hypothetical protein
MCAAAPSSAGPDAAPTRSAAASHARRSCIQPKLCSPKAKCGPKVSERVEEEETVVERQALGHVVAVDFALPRSGAHRRASLPLPTASPPPPRLPLGRRGAYTISQASTLISTVLRLSATTSARQQHLSARNSYTNMRARLRHTRHW